MMKFLFAGCGSIGRRHIQNLKSLVPCEILAFRVRKDDWGDFGRKYSLRTFDDLDQALDENPHAVFVTNPTSLHLPVALKAAERGIPLFIEKPLSHNLEGVEEFIRLCQKKKIPVLLGYKMRFHPSIVGIKKIIDSGKLGKIFAVRAQYGGYLPDWHPWEDYRRMYSSRQELGGGIVLDAATHELDYLYWLLGDIVEVKSFCGKLSDLEIDTEDTAEILLRFRSGTLGSVHVNYVQRPEYRSCQVIGEKGTVFWDTLKKRVDVFDGEKNAWESFPEAENWDPNEMFVAEMKHFLACLEGKEKPVHDLFDARRVLELCLQAKEHCVSVRG